MSSVERPSTGSRASPSASREPGVAEGPELPELLDLSKPWLVRWFQLGGGVAIVATAETEAEAVALSFGAAVRTSDLHPRVKRDSGLRAKPQPLITPRIAAAIDSVSNLIPGAAIVGSAAGEARRQRFSRAMRAMREQS